MAGNKPPLYLGKSIETGGPVVFSGEGSLLTVGPPGTGKSRGVAIWNLLSYPGSMLVTDPKGQLVKWSASVRQAMGHSVAVLDPFGLTGWPSSSVNPLSAVVAAVQRETGFRTEAERLAHLLLCDVPGQDPYWRSGGRGLLIAGLLYLAAFKPSGCDLPGLHGVLWLGEEAFVGEVLGPMVNSAALGGALRQYGLDVLDLVAKRPKNFGIFREEARSALSIFAPDEPCGRACKVSDIDLAELISGKLTVYLVLPPEYVASHGRWMGLIVSHAIQSVMQVRGVGDCVFLLDEFANLGRLPNVRDAIAQLREKGLRVWPFVQELSQLEAVYGRPEMEAMRYQAEVLQLLGGCNTAELAEYVEKRAGTYTERVKDFSVKDPLDDMAAPSYSLKDEKMPVLPASQAMNLPKLRQILIRRGFPVIVADIDLWRGG